MLDGELYVGLNEDGVFLVKDIACFVVDLTACAKKRQAEAWVYAAFLEGIINADGVVRCGQSVLVDAHAEFSGKVEQAEGRWGVSCGGHHGIEWLDSELLMLACDEISWQHFWCMEKRCRGSKGELASHVGTPPAPTSRHLRVFILRVCSPLTDDYQARCASHTCRKSAPYAPEGRLHLHALYRCFMHPSRKS